MTEQAGAARSNPVLDLLQKALEDGTLQVELRGERHGADRVVPAMFTLYHTFGSSKVRVSQLEAKPYMRDRA